MVNMSTRKRMSGGIGAQYMHTSAYRRGQSKIQGKENQRKQEIEKQNRRNIAIRDAVRATCRNYSADQFAFYKAKCENYGVYAPTPNVGGTAKRKTAKRKTAAHKAAHAAKSAAAHASASASAA